MQDVSPIHHCLACGGNNLNVTLNLGNQPPANSFHIGKELPDSFPLGIQTCNECWHSQLTHAVNPSLLFKHYLYVSGTSHTLNVFFEDIATRFEAIYPKGASLLEIACNDGTLLEKFKNHGFDVMGVDPASNIRELSKAKGLDVIVDFFTQTVAQSMKKKFDIIIGQNVCAHTPDPLDMLVAAKSVLKTNGRIHIQTSQAFMLQNGEFDTIYHEHYSFFTLNSMAKLAERAGLTLIDWQLEPVHGGSHHFILAHSEDKVAVKVGMLAALKRETAEGLYAPDLYKKFAINAETLKQNFVQKIAEYKEKNYKIIGLGAAAKANTFLNYVEGKLDAIIDQNPQKIGLLSPGQNIPIVAPDFVKSIETPILFVLSAWNFKDEMMRTMKPLRGLHNDEYMRYFPNILIEPSL